MTEGKWGLLAAGVRAIQTRVERLAGDEAVLSDEMLDADAGYSVTKWGQEAGRIARELADIGQTVDRLLGPRESAGLDVVDESADTAVIGLASLIGDDE